MVINWAYTPSQSARTVKPRRHNPRRAVTKRDRAVLVYFPAPIVAAVDLASRVDDTDRSKWIRKAVRDALQRRGVD